MTVNYQAKVTSSQEVHKFDSIAAFDEQIQNRLNALIMAKTEILEAIETITDDKQRLVLTMRYINGESYEAIADSLYYEVRQIYRIHGAALNTIALYMNNNNLEV